MSARAGTAFVDIHPDWKPFDRAVARHGSVIARQGDRIGKDLGGRLTRGASIAIKAGAVGVAGAAIYAVKKAADFEGQVSSLGAVSDASGKQLEGLRKQALKAGADTKFSALQAAQAQTELAKGGLAVSKIMRGGLRASLALAAAGEMELADAAETTVNAMKLFGLRGKDTMKVADALATAANRTTADVSDFALALKMGGSVAKLAGLDFNETVVVLEALAEAGIKGSDAGTSMKAFFLNLTRDAPKAKEAMKQLGVEIFDQQGELKSLPEISRNLRSAFGDLTREQFLNKAGTIAGSDAIRTLWALYDAGPSKLTGLERATAKQGTAADVARKKQDNLKGSMEQLGGSAETLGINVGTMMIPAIREGADELTGLANKISKIAERDDLDLGEKLSRSFEVAKVDAEPWIDKLEQALEEADVPGKLGDLLSAATPEIAEAVAKSAPIVAGAFVRAWTESNVWGRLVIGGWLLTKLGGPAAFRRVGQQAGAQMGAGMAAGMGPAVTGGIAQSGLRGRLAGIFRGYGPLMAGSVAVVFGPELIRQLDEKAHPTAINGLPRTSDALGRGLRSALGDALKGDVLDLAKLGVNAPGQLAGGITTALGITSDSEGRLRRFGDTADATFKKLRGAQDVKGLAKLAADARRLARDFPQAAGVLNKFADDVSGVGRKAKWTEGVLDQMSRGSSSSIESLRAKVKLSTHRIKKYLGEDTAAGEKALTDNFYAAATNIHRSMDMGKISVKEGTAEIERLMVKALQSVGFTKAQALRVRAGQEPDSGKAAGTHTGKQRGGMLATGGSMVVPGTGAGDKVHLQAMVEPGEKVFVLNRNASRQLSELQTLNAAVPRFQAGGIVALGRRLQSEGYNVSEHPAFPPFNPGAHAADGYHPKGMALDVNDDDAPGGEAASLDRLYARLKGTKGVVELLWRVADHFDHLHVAMRGPGGPLAGIVPKLKRLMVDGPASPLKGVVQGALDLVHAGAQATVTDAAGAMSIEGSEAGVGMSRSGPVESVFASVAKRLSRSKVATQALGMAGYAESGMRDLAGGHLSSTGSLQLLASTAAGMGIDPHDEAAVASAFFQRGFYGKGGANALAAQGLPAHLVAQDVQGSAFSDGSNYLAQAGRARAWMDRYGLQLGGLVGLQAGGPTISKDAIRRAAQNRRRLGLSGALNTLRTGKTPKIRKDAIGGLVERIKGVDLPKDLKRNLSSYATDANTFGEFAERAAQLTVEPVGGEGDPIEGVVGGKTQTEWLTQQLEALFRWRNAIIDAERIVVERREQTAKLIEQARERLKTIVAEIGATAKTRKAIAGQLERAQKHPKRNRALIKILRGNLGKIDMSQRVNERVRAGLKDRILPALTGQRSALNTARGTLLENLDTVQGIGSPGQRLTSLPPVGVLGGSIMDVQLRLRDLAAPREMVTDTATPVTDSQSAGALTELLRLANLRTAVSEAHFDEYGRRDLPPYGGSYGDGGVVPGPVGAARTIIAHGGETVLTAGESPAGGTVLHVHHLYIDGRELDVKIDSRVEHVTRDRSNRARRQLQAGVLRR